MNVRWDAVVDRARFDVAEAPPARLTTKTTQPGRAQVRVRLFGALAAVCSQRCVTFELAGAATLADVLAALGERLGEPFRVRVLDEAGIKRRYCRLFVDGVPVDDLQTVLDSSSQPTEIEMILLIAPEGG